MGFRGGEGPRGPTGPTGPTGPEGPLTNEWWFSPVDQMVAGTAPGEGAGNFTTGISFQVTRQVTVSGIRFYKAGGTTRTYRAKLRNAAGATLATVDVACTSTGVYIATFASAQVLTQEAGSSATYKVSIYELTGSFYTRIATGSPCILPAASGGTTFPFLASRSVIVKHLGAFAGGDANPASEAAGERYPVEPVVEN